MRRFFFTTVALALVLSAPRLSVEAQEARRARAPENQGAGAIGRCLLRVERPDTKGARGAQARSFSASEVGDLRFDVWLRQSRSSEPIEIHVYSPGDKLYQILRAKADQEALTPRGRRRASDRGLAVLSASFPLVGTHVTRRALYGEWRAEAKFIAAEGPCTPAVLFAIEP